MIKIFAEIFLWKEEFSIKQIFTKKKICRKKLVKKIFNPKKKKAINSVNEKFVVIKLYFVLDKMKKLWKRNEISAVIWSLQYYRETHRSGLVISILNCFLFFFLLRVTSFGISWLVHGRSNVRGLVWVQSIIARKCKHKHSICESLAKSCSYQPSLWAIRNVARCITDSWTRASYHELYSPERIIFSIIECKREIDWLID